MGDLVGGPKQTSAVNPWAVKYLRMFDMTNDSHLFRTRAELQGDGWYPTEGGRIRKGEATAIPLYVGKMFNQFDHRAANVDVNDDSLHHATLSDLATLEQKRNAEFFVEPQYWIDSSDVADQKSWHLAFRSIARSTDIRTMIAALLPTAGFGNSAPLIEVDSAETASMLVANLNSFVFDYVSRSKVQTSNVNWYIVEQLPVIPPADYDRKFGTMTAREIVAREVLHLTYTAHDMAAFARDMGYDGEPFIWNDADRRQRRARLDALYFHLYGIGKDDADYILSTFPIVCRHDEDESKGRYVTRDLILAQMDALAAGDVDAVISLR
jgi:hypothetical protein